MAHVGSKAPVKMSVSPGVRTSPNNSAGGRKRRLVLFQIVMLAVVLGLVWYGFGRYVLAPEQSSSVPQYIGALRLASHIEGPEAQTQINRLHGTDISLESAFIAEYRGEYGGDRIQVWAGSAGSEVAAADLINRMVNGINKGGTGFTNLRQVKVAGRDVWQVDGKGGQFFFYIALEPADRVIWLTIEGSNSASLLESAVKIF